MLLRSITDADSATDAKDRATLRRCLSALLDLMRLSLFVRQPGSCVAEVSSAAIRLANCCRASSLERDTVRTLCSVRVGTVRENASTNSGLLSRNILKAIASVIDLIYHHTDLPRQCFAAAGRSATAGEQ